MGCALPPPPPPPPQLLPERWLCSLGSPFSCAPLMPSGFPLQAPPHTCGASMVLIFWGGFGQQTRWYIGPLVTLAPLLLPLLGSGLIGLPLSLLSFLVSCLEGREPWWIVSWFPQGFEDLPQCIVRHWGAPPAWIGPPGPPTTCPDRFGAPTLHAVRVWWQRDLGVRLTHPDLATAGLKCLPSQQQQQQQQQRQQQQ